MGNINLLESAQGKGSSAGSMLGIKSIYIPLLVLFAILIIWGGSKAYSTYLLGQKNKVDEQNQLESANLSGKSADRLVDFNERMKKASEESADRANFEDYLKELESIMISGSNVESLKYSSDKIEILMTADNFKTVARQILGFKNSKYFKDLGMEKTSFDESGKIKFDLIK